MVKQNVFFSNRLHVLLLSYKYGAPPICVSDIQKHRKIRGIFTDNELENLLLDVNDNMDELMGKINALLGMTDVIEQNIRVAEMQNYKKLDGIFRKIF